MRPQRRGTRAVAAAVVAVVLWQLTTELATWLTGQGDAASAFAWLPTGSPLSFGEVAALAPAAGPWLLGLLLSAAILGLAVGLGVRFLTRSGHDGVATVLAVWIVVQLAAVLASALSLLVVNAGDGAPSITFVPLVRGAYWGMLFGWLVALVAVLGERGGDRAGSA